NPCAPGWLCPDAGPSIGHVVFRLDPGPDLVVRLALEPDPRAIHAQPAGPLPGTSRMPTSRPPPTLPTAPSCPPESHRLVVAPVGAAWIGTMEGVFEPDDGGRPMASWTVDEVLAGSPDVADGQLTYLQPACDGIVLDHETRYVITTADPTGPDAGN